MPKVRCSMCDMAKATKYRIPACKRPAKHWVKDKVFGRLYLCEYHWRRATVAQKR